MQQIRHNQADQKTLARNQALSLLLRTSASRQRLVHLWSVRKTCHFFSAPVKFWTNVTGWMAASPTGIDVRIRWPSAEMS